MMRRIALFAAAMVCSVSVAAAQDPVAVRSADEPCFRARPYPACRAFFVTSSGVYGQLGAGPGVSPLQATIDWGAMANLSPKNAVGGSWFVTYTNEGTVFSTGPVLRWRRWLGPVHSLDVAVGTPIAGGHSNRPGSVLGLVKYNPVHWFGVAARPELVRYDDYNCTDCSRPVSRTKTRLYLGAELGGLPGFVVGATAAAGLGVLALLLASSLSN